MERYISKYNFIDSPHTWLIIMHKTHVIVSLVWLIMKILLHPFDHKSC